MEQKHITCDIEMKGEEGYFAGYASVFSVVDSQNDAILPGAFTKSLSNDVKLLWQHDVQEPIGVFTHMHEDAHGLYVEGRLLLDVARGKEAYSLLKAKALNGMSIGYRVKEYGYDETSGVRYLTEVELFEISLVTFPANSAATVTHVKADTIREFEQFLRKNGYSRTQAKTISGHGFVTPDSMADLRIALRGALNVLDE